MSFKCELLFSIYMPTYFSVIGIRKYVVKRLYLTYVTQFHGLDISNDYNYKRPEINRKACEK